MSDSIANKSSDLNYNTLKVKDCIIKLTTGLNPRDNFSLGSGNIKYITAKNLNRQGTIDFTNCDYIDENAKNIVHNRSGIKKGNILFSSRAPIGSCHLIKEEPNYYDIGESIFCITVNEEVVLPEYLCLYFTSDFFVQLSSKHITGSVIKEIRVGDLLELPVIVPKKSIQQKIIYPISSIDAKIAINNFISFKLEALAKEIYEYWFVQFDFPDKNGKPYKSSGGKMVWSDELNREIPEGWEVKLLGKVADLYQPKTISDNDFVTDGQYLVYGANGIVGKYDKYNHECNEVAICCRGASCGQYIMTQPYSWITGNAMVATPKTDEISREYLYNGLSLKLISRYITGSAQPQITRTDIEMMKILVPNKSILTIYDDIVTPFRLQLQNLFSENEELTKLRNFLLPMLINGQVSVV